MEETDTQIDAHNAEVLVEEIQYSLGGIIHEAQRLQGLLDDLGVYLPKDAATS